MTADVVINAIDEAIDSSYRKGGEKASYVEGISKQAVMNKISIRDNGLGITENKVQEIRESLKEMHEMFKNRDNQNFPYHFIRLNFLTPVINMC